MEDEKIIMLFNRRDECAIRALDEKYGARLLRLAERVSGDREEAKEALNDTYLAIWNTIPPKEPKSLFAYSAKITRNIAVKEYRYKTAIKRNTIYDTAINELEEILPSNETAYEILTAKELREYIEAFLNSQKHLMRVIFVYR